MNEVENHYGAVGETHDAAAGRPDGSSPAAVAKSVLDQASAKAKDALKAASSTASAARDEAGRAYGQASGWAQDQYGAASEKAADLRRRSAAELSKHRRSVETVIDENPVMLAVAGFAAGLMVGALLPGTRRENKLFGRYADEVRDQGLRYAHDLAEQGKHFVEDNLDSAKRRAAEPPAG